MTMFSSLLSLPIVYLLLSCWVNIFERYMSCQYVQRDTEQHSAGFLWHMHCDRWRCDCRSLVKCLWYKIGFSSATWSDQTNTLPHICRHLHCWCSHSCRLVAWQNGARLCVYRCWSMRSLWWFYCFIYESTFYSHFTQLVRDFCAMDHVSPHFCKLVQFSK